MLHRLAVIGPERRRTGTGPFVAEYLRQAGCSVVGWDRADAGHWLAPGAPRPEVDAVAICSPAETHFEYLVSALAKGLHVFCEKPVVWPADHSVAAFAALILGLEKALDAARLKHLVVHENTQWVYTLKDFRRLAGNCEPNEIRRFRCELSPSSGTAPEMLMECSAHANSLLLELGCDGLEDLRTDVAEAVLEVGFRSRAVSGAPVEVQYRFAQKTRQPRAAAYEINGRRVERRVEMNGYRVFLAFGGQEHPIRDPLQSSVEDFLAKISAPEQRQPSSILANLRMSCSMLKACHDYA
jgi:hypothetical protein